MVLGIKKEASTSSGETPENELELLVKHDLQFEALDELYRKD